MRIPAPRSDGTAVACLLINDVNLASAWSGLKK
jgi:hypothetical protein